MWGIYSTWSKTFCFGIAAPSKQIARKELFIKIGKDAYKWRFEVRKIVSDADANKNNSNRRSQQNMPITNNDTKVVTGKVRLSYASVFVATAIDGGDEKYSTAILIPKSDKDTLRKIKAAVDAALEQGKSKWGGKVPANVKKPLRDGDEEKPDDENYAGHYFLNASSKNKPGIAKPIGKDADGRTKFQEITDTTEVYSGCYCKVSLNFYPFDAKGNRGVAAGLNNIVKVQDGDFLGGRSNVKDDFADVEFEDDDNESYLD